MSKSINKQIFYRVLLSSPVIAFLILTPIYLVYGYKVQTYFEIWLRTFIGVLFWWGIQIFIFSFFKKRNYPNWVIGLTLLGLIFLFVLLTKVLAPILTPGLMYFSEQTLFILRLIINISTNFIIFLLLDLIYSREEKLRLVKDNSKLKYQNLESKYKLLKAQINPHFLFNALNISKSLIKTKPNDAEKYIIGLSKFLRDSLNNQQKLISLEKELAHCQQYIDLQKVRFENAFTYYVDLEDIHLKKMLPFYALITLVENAFKHNSFSEEAPLNILITIRGDCVMVKNNLAAKNGVVSTHTGLSNLNERSKMFSNAEIKIDNDGQHFSVQIKLIKP